MGLSLRFRFQQLNNNQSTLKQQKMDLMQEIIANAQANKQRIVLPEGDEPRTLKAADRLLADGVADIILIGPAEKI